LISIESVATQQFSRRRGLDERVNVQRPLIRLVEMVGWVLIEHPLGGTVQLSAGLPEQLCSAIESITGRIEMGDRLPCDLIMGWRGDALQRGQAASVGFRGLQTFRSKSGPGLAACVRVRPARRLAIDTGFRHLFAVDELISEIF